MSAAREIVEQWKQRLEAESVVWPHLGGRYAIEVTGKEGGVWVIDLRMHPMIEPVAAGGGATDSDAYFRIPEEEFPSIASGITSAQEAFLTGKLKVSGKLSAVLKFNRVLTRLIAAV